jgi:hypothetical protein
MTFFGLLGHLAGLLAPAAAVALMLALAPRLRRAGRTFRRRWTQDFGLLFLAGAVVLLLGLVLLGRDAKMLTYAGLVLVQGSLGFWLQRR